MLASPPLIDAVLAASTGARSYLHGERHWRAVAHAGLDLAWREPPRPRHRPRTPHRDDLARVGDCSRG